jgi:hypothetical protein
MNSAKHSSESNEYYTPPSVVKKARSLLGGFDLDPFSCSKANEIVRASAYYDHDGFTRPMRGRIFMNPPGGVIGDSLLAKEYKTRSCQAMALEILIRKWILGEVESAFFVAFQLSPFRIVGGIRRYEIPFIIPSSRLKFWTSQVDLLLGTTSKQDESTRAWLSSRLRAIEEDLPGVGDFRSLAQGLPLNSRKGFLSACSYIEKQKKLKNYILTRSKEVLLPSVSPTQDNALLYLPPKRVVKGVVCMDEDRIKTFYQTFSDIGQIPARYQ